MWMVLGDGLLMTGAGIAIGLLLAALASTGVRTLLYPVNPRDPLVFGAAAY